MHKKLTRYTKTVIYKKLTLIEHVSKLTLVNIPRTIIIFSETQFHLRTVNDKR